MYYYLITNITNSNIMNKMNCKFCVINQIFEMLKNLHNNGVSLN